MTLYDKIYERFLQKVTDYKMLTLPEDDMYDMWHGWLKSAVAKQKVFIHSLEMDDVGMCFPADLDNIEIEVLAVGMAVEWLEPQVKSVNNTMQLFSNSEQKFYSQANHLTEIRAMLKALKNERKKLVRDYQYNVFAQTGA